MENQKFKEIKFKDIQSAYNDSNSIVATAMLFDYTEDGLKDLEEGLREIGLINPDKHLIDCRFITDNVRGDGRNGADARVDHLLVFDNPASQFNPLVRLQFNFLKWTSNFLTIYRDDYGY